MARRRRMIIDTAPETMVVWMSAGFCLAVPGVLLGFGLVALPSVLVVVGVAGAFWVASDLHGLRKQFRKTDARLTALSDQIERLAAGPRTDHRGPDENSLVRWLDLAELGVGRPDDLAAATLDRSTFPRLAVAKNTSTEPPRFGTCAATVNQLRRWKRALRTGDLTTCRLAFSVLVDTGDPSTVAVLRSQLTSLEDRIEKSLRDSFRRHFREQNLPKLLAVGDEMVRLLPHRSIARDFHQLRPKIAARAAMTTNPPKPALRIVE